MTIIEYFNWLISARNWRSPILLSEIDDLTNDKDEDYHDDEYETFYKTEAKMTAECDVSDEKKVRVWAFNKAGTYGHL